MTPEWLDAARRFCEALNIGYAELVSIGLAAFIWFLSKRYDKIVQDYREDRVQLERMTQIIEGCVEEVRKSNDRLKAIEQQLQNISMMVLRE